MPEEAAWAHKYVMILDGNTFSSRLMRTLRSGSLVFRAGLFTEWFDERLEPFLHYLPVRVPAEVPGHGTCAVATGQCS